MVSSIRFVLGCFLVISSLLSHRTRGELYSSSVELEELLNTQKAVVGTLQHYLEQTEERLEKIKKFKEQYANLLNVSEKDFSFFVSNPLNAFILIKKLTVDWNATKGILFQNYMPDHLIKWRGAVFPDMDDLSGAAQALLRLQEIYDVEVSSITEGYLHGIKTEHKFSADDCFEMGRQALFLGRYDYSIAWFEMARIKLQSEKKPVIRNLTDSYICKYISLSNFEKGRSMVLHFTQNLMQLGYMIEGEFKTDNSGSGNVMNEKLQNSYMTSAKPVDVANYYRLCQAKQGIELGNHPPKLKCKLVRHPPFFTLRPIEEEELWEDPKISIYHNVISDSEINIMKSLAVPMLERAQVAEYAGSITHRVSETRVTKTAWLNKSDHPIIGLIYQRIGHITGLSTTSAEPFQMANYGLGGHFHLHLDLLPNSEAYFGPETGNRIATWLSYLSDVDDGGATVFPRLNLTVWPKKGSALFWHNIKSNGDGDILTLHGACPVIAGTKWVTNVWLHERGQEFRLRCGKTPESALVQTIDSF